jgi:quercetin dioxygenase-like cupin family protein
MKHPDVSRVILTRNEDDGTSDYEILSAKADTLFDDAGHPVFTVTQLWGTLDGIPRVGPGINPAQVIDPWFPGAGGVRFRFFTFEPDQPKDKTKGDDDPLLLENVQGEGLSNFVEAFDPDRPGMHISDSVDFVFVMSGEAVMELERREILVKQGDIIIMRGGWHNWRNETDQPCTVASVMVGAHRTKP